jgi:hypothetical protein
MHEENGCLITPITEDIENRFYLIKEKLNAILDLTLLNFNKLFEVKYDAYDVGIKVVFT